jgi:hypothetical protein
MKQEGGGSLVNMSAHAHKKSHAWIMWKPHNLHMSNRKFTVLTMSCPYPAYPLTFMSVTFILG